MHKTKLFSAALVAAGSLFATQSALAYGAGDFFVRGGIAKTDVKSDNGSAAGQDLDISDENGFYYGVGYIFHDKLGLELSGTEKFEHDLALENAGGIGSADRMPVNLMLNFYPLGGTDNKVQPYIGAGVNYTRFSGEDTVLNDVQIDDSWGATGQIGVDLAITDNLMLNGFANYADVDADIDLNGNRVGEAEVDPVTIGGGVTLRF